MATPEGRIKTILKKRLDEWQKTSGRSLNVHWPVQSGYGSPTLDADVTCNGYHLKIETKAPGGKFTKRQWETAVNHMRAGGIVLGYSAFENEDIEIIEVLNLMNDNYRNSLEKCDVIMCKNLARYQPADLPDISTIPTQPRTAKQ